MKQFACQYAPIRFLPYAETGEFANVGVVLACPETGFLDARVLPARRTGRITGFFEQLDVRIYREAMTYLRQEVRRVHKLTATNVTHEPDIARHLFTEVTRPREAILRFGETRVLLTKDPSMALQEQYDELVERNFADKAYHDRLLERGIRETLHKANVRDHFKPGRLGNDALHLTVPFLHMGPKKRQLAIKPLDLAKGQADLVYATGGRLVDRVHRLAHHQLMPDGLLFAVNPPARQTGDTRTIEAADEIIGDLRRADGVEVTTVDNQTAITAFAQRAAVD